MIPGYNAPPDASKEACLSCGGTGWNMALRDRLMPLRGTRERGGDYWWVDMGASIQRQQDWLMLNKVLEAVSQIPTTLWHAVDCKFGEPNITLADCNCTVWPFLSRLFDIPSPYLPGGQNVDSQRCD